MLRLEDVSVRLGTFTLKADLALDRGERLAVMGASGSGKSTLLNLIAGFLWPDAGKVRIDGREVTRLPVSDRPLSILFQDGNLFPHLSVFDNVAIGLRPNLRLSAEEAAAVRDSLAKVGLAEMAGRRPADLSGGQRSRVAIARMLIRDKPLALLDEPFAALDPGLRAEMLDLLHALCDETGLTLVIVTHDLKDAERLCTRLCLLDGGAVVLDRPLAGLRQDHPPVLDAWL